MALRSSDNDDAMLGSFAPAGEPSAFVFDATSGGEITLPSGKVLSDSTYLQQGDDLVLIGTDGTTFVVRDYFLLDNPPDLVAVDGGRMTPALVDSFTPPEAAGQYAQTGQVAQAATPIGQVQDQTGQAFAIRADGSRVALQAGDPVFQGDVIETGDGGAVSLLFVDETTFALGDSARLALDEMVYNPTTQEGQSSFSILKGVFVFVSGQIAHTDNTKMTVTTPVATIGIRGTRVAGDIRPAGEESKFTVIDGEIAIITQGGTVLMRDPNATTRVTSFQSPPSEPVILSNDEIVANYGSTGGVSGGLGSPEDVSPEGGGGGGEGEGGGDVVSVTGGDFAVGGVAGGPAGDVPGFGDIIGDFGEEFDTELEDDLLDPITELDEDDLFIDLGEGEGEGIPTTFDATGSLDPQTFVGSDSSEQILGGQAGDNLSGVGGADVISGNGGNDNIDGGEGNDLLTGGDGDDSVFGGVGDDILIAASGQGNDTYNGGDGADLAIFSSAINSITVDLSQGSASGVDIDNDVLIDIENVFGGAGDDTIIGNAAENQLFGGGGNDTITGGLGSDIVTGGDGDDTIIASGDFAFDFYDGGAGTDTADYSNVSSGVVIDLAAGFATYNPGELGIITDTVTNFENASGGASGDTITGTSGNNIFFGSTGNDTYNGGAGFDQLTYDIAGLFIDFSLTEIDGPRRGTVSGAGFIDTFEDIDAVFATAGVVNVLGSVRTEFFGGSVGSDTIDGAGGDDFLDGNAGDDTVLGGDGNDTIVFDAADSNVDGGTGNDTLSVEESNLFIDLAVEVGSKSGFEFIDMSAQIGVGETDEPIFASNNTLSVDLDDVSALTDNNTLTVVGDETTILVTQTNWEVSAQVGSGFQTLTLDGVVLLVDDRIAVENNVPTFLGSLDTSWSNDSNWSTGSAPVDGDTVQIDSDVNYDVGADTTLATFSGLASLSITGGSLLVSELTEFGGGIFMDGGSGFGGSGSGSDFVTLSGDLLINGSDIDLVGSNGITANGNVDLGGTINLATDLNATNSMVFQDQFVADNFGGSINNTGAASATDATVTINTSFSNAGGLDITRSDFTTDGFDNLSGGSVVIEVGSRSSSLTSTGGLTNNGDITLDSSLNEEGESAAITVTGDVFRNEADGTIDLINASSTSNVIDAQLLNLGAVNVSGFGDTRFIGSDFAHNGGNIAMAAGSEIRFIGGTFDLNGGDITTSGAATVSMEGGTLDLSVDFTAVSDLSFIFEGTATVVGNGIFTNLGTFDVNTNLDLSNTLDNADGVLDVVGGSTLTVNSGGALVVGVDSVLSGAGGIRFESGSSFDVAANDSFDLSSATAEIELDTGATVGGAGTFTNTGLADIIDVDITIDADNVVNQSGGTLQFLNNVTTIDSANFLNDLGGTLELDSTTGATRATFSTDWTNNGVISLTGDTDVVDAVIDLGANTLTNSASGVIKVGGASSLTNHQITGNVQNDGNVLIENGGAVFANGTFSNGGTIDVGNGNLLRPGAVGTDNFINEAGGEINLNTGGRILSSFGTVTNDGVINMGTGSIDIASNSIFLQNSNLTIGNGAAANVSFGDSGGTLGGTGTVTVDAGGAINLGVGGVLDVDTVNDGLVSSNNNTFTVNGTLTNQGTGNIDFSTSGTLTGTGAFVNDGDVTMTTAGNISIADFTNTGNFTFGEGSYSVGPGVNFTNGVGGTLSLDATPGGSSFLQVGSDFTNLGLINLTSDQNAGQGVLRFEGQTFTNSGTLLVDGTSTAAPNMFGDLLVNTGLIDINNPQAFQLGIETITNSGTIDVGDASRLALDQNAGSVNVLNNVAGGTITLNSTGDFFVIADNAVVNDGVFDIGSGLLSIFGNGVFTQNTDLTVGSGASIEIGASGSSGTFDGTGTVSIESGATVDLDGGSRLNAAFTNAGIMNLSGTVTNTVEVQGIASANLTGGVINSNFASNFDMGGTGVFTNEAAININNGSILTLQNGEFRNVPTGVIDGTGTLNIASDGVFTQDGGDLSVVFSNAGIINFQGADSTVNISGANAVNLASGLVNVIGNVTFDMDADFTFSNFGDFVFSGGTLTTQNGEFRNETGGDMSGSGAVVGDITNAGGSFSVGASPGELTIFGNLSNGNSTHMTTELGGLVAGTEFDRLNVTETFSLGGTITIEEYDGFEVGAGDSFKIISAGEISGSFNEANGLDVGRGVVLDLTQSETDITLVGHAVTHQGDSSDNILTGSAGDDVFSAGAGNDTVVGNGGADLVHTGDGDDIFVASDTSFGRFDGGSGTDLITFDGAGQNFDLTSLRGDQLSGIERIDFSGFGDNILTLDTDMAFAATSNENALTGEAHSLIIDGDAGDTLNAIGDWTNTGTVTIEGTGYSVFQNSANDAQIFVDDDVAVSGVA